MRPTPARSGVNVSDQFDAALKRAIARSTRPGSEDRAKALRDAKEFLDKMGRVNRPLTVLELQKARKAVKYIEREEQSSNPAPNLSPTGRMTFGPPAVLKHVIEHVTKHKEAEGGDRTWYAYYMVVEFNGIVQREIPLDRNYNQIPTAFQSEHGTWHHLEAPDGDIMRHTVRGCREPITPMIPIAWHRADLTPVCDPAGGATGLGPMHMPEHMRASEAKRWQECPRVTLDFETRAKADWGDKVDALCYAYKIGDEPVRVVTDFSEIEKRAAEFYTFPDEPIIVGMACDPAKCSEPVFDSGDYIKMEREEAPTSSFADRIAAEMAKAREIG